MFGVPISQPILSLDPSLEAERLEDIRGNLSATMLRAGHLWLGGDEGVFVDRLTRGDDGNFGRHRRFDLRFFVELPGKHEDPSEIDIEGLDWDSGCLWLTGSHSLKRDKPKDSKPAKENRSRLAKLDVDPNRYTLARVPVGDDGEPVAEAGDCKAAILGGDEEGSELSHALAKDPHIGPFCEIPSKDNGLDIEGLAVRGSRVFLGLRGPVLRGWAVLVDFDVKEAGKGSLTLAGSYRLHFLELDGLGIRDLAVRERDLYILAGPTMDLDGPVFIYCWPKALDVEQEALVWRKELKKVLAVPYGRGRDVGSDHPEGMTLFPTGDGDAVRVLVCYDSPAKSRVVSNHQVRVDVFELALEDIEK